MPAPRMIRTVSAVILDPQERVLLVRKRGSEIYIQPGGKPDAGEAPLDTLERELREELDVTMDRAQALCLGRFEDEAVHEPDARVRTESWLVQVQGEPRASAEIEALRWVEPQTAGEDPTIAPLSRRHILPALCRHLASEPDAR
ncbi:NUDIX hydrolase [Wenzhouxiangella marina]|uniref:NUDIX hydrolase n=1 Tax=Wenzhouxiangella marina TaxID=1579979 RepID=A0A0K0XTS0_9GAMM|nr:NUDIX domain-containing protein [Wenzhouxiangella marina]AKS41078.1 NUDIX hydrolase [Wenzhouxiangella marina]MBB6087956.1 ADP-ribose pyrophosphatase YjhB (NUDIX family) [Wenzhouxiangella marina]